MQIEELAKRLQRQKIGIKLTTPAKNWLLDKGYDVHNGVRPMRRTIQDEIEDQIAEGILRGDYGSGDVIKVDVAKKQLTLSAIHE